MANSNTVQTLLDGHRNVIIQVVGVLDTSNQALTTILDASTLDPAPTDLRIDKITYSISGQLGVQLLWDATADVVAAHLFGYGHVKYKCCGGLTNNAGTGKNGDLLMQTTGWASGVQGYTLLIELVKNGVQ